MCPLTRLSPRGLVQVPAKVRVVSTRSSSNSRRQCYWSRLHHITEMKLLLLGQWLTRPIGDIPHTILPSGAQGACSCSWRRGCEMRPPTKLNTARTSRIVHYPPIKTSHTPTLRKHASTALVPHNLSLSTTSRRIRAMILRVR